MKRVAFFLILFFTSMLVYFVGGYWVDLSHQNRTVVKVLLPIFFLLSTYFCGRITPLRNWKHLSLAFLAASSGFLFAWLLSDPLQNAVGVKPDTVPGIALCKLIESILIVVPVLLVARAGGMTPSDLYLQKGKSKPWLVTGLTAFVVFTALFLLRTFGQGLTGSQLLVLAPWTLIFIFANSFMEELHFRGLLLRPFGELLGPHASNLCIALFFTLVHAPVQYTPDIALFLSIVFVLAITWGYLIQKTEALWGSVLFHAGADLMIVVGIYEAYGGL